jgi:hypothetical protein
VASLRAASRDLETLLIEAGRRSRERRGVAAAAADDDLPGIASAPQPGGVRLEEVRLQLAAKMAELAQATSHAGRFDLEAEIQKLEPELARLGALEAAMDEALIAALCLAALSFMHARLTVPHDAVALV